MAIELKSSNLGVLRNSVGSSFNRGDFTNGNAFFWSSINLSYYLNSLIELIDATGKKALGYLAGVGAGETLGSEVITVAADREFSSDTGFWVKDAGCTIALGVAHFVAVAVNFGLNQNADLLTYLALYKGILTVSNHVAGNLDISSLSRTSLSTGNGLKTGYILGASNGRFYVIAGTTASLDADDVSFKRVTDPPATAVHIVSALNGTTRNWSSVEAGFNPNTITSWNIYQIKIPSIKNKFSKLSFAKLPVLWSGKSNPLIASRYDDVKALMSGVALYSHLIAWYWNDEGAGNIVYNMTPVNPLLGGGALPDLDVIDSTDYWLEAGFGNCIDDGINTSYLQKEFPARNLYSNCSVGQFIKRTGIYSESFQFEIDLSDLEEENELKIGIITNDLIINNRIENNLADFNEFINIQDEWIFQFIDESGYLNIAHTDGTLETFSDSITLVNFLMEKLFLGSKSIPTKVSIGDIFIFNNISLTTAQWGSIYDLCRNRYGMEERTW